MRKFHSIPVCPSHQMDQPLFNVVVPEARRGIKNVGHPVGIFGRWYRDLCECLCCCFSWVVFARAKWIQGWWKVWHFRSKWIFGVCQSSWILVFGLWVLYGIISRCSEIMIKFGYGKWTTPTQVTYTRRELYLFNKLGELTGTNESLFFEWLRSCGVVSPWQLCLHCLQDVYRRVSGVCLSHSVRLRLEGNISATFAAQLCHQHVPETERPDLWLPRSRSLSSFQLARQGRSQGFSRVLSLLQMSSWSNSGQHRSICVFSHPSLSPG